MEHRVLVVDDEADIRATVEILLGRMQLLSEAADSVASAMAALQQRPYDLVLCDMRLGDGSGLDLVRWLNVKQPQIPVAVITAYSSTEDAVEALKAGAFDYVSKPVDLDVLRRIVQDALKTKALDQAAPAKPDQGLVGDSEQVQELRRMIDKVGRTQAPVFLFGESGTGKELVARQIHARGPRCDADFVAVNCGAIPPELFESELFGHLRGSFTGATRDKQGLFSAADGGTLFLDEVADLPLPMQVKLLRVLQERHLRPVGATQEQAVDVRIVSAAHADLREAVDQGRFREDLYYRLNVITLPIPPLRERRDDIAPLCQHLLADISRRLGIPRPTLETQALEQLQAYAFPGNVRELENLLERACALSEPGSKIDLDDLQLPQHDVEAEPMNSAQTTGSIDGDLAQNEKQRILAALESTRWNRTQAAKQLGISFRSLRYRLQKLGLDTQAKPNDQN